MLYTVLIKGEFPCIKGDRDTITKYIDVKPGSGQLTMNCTPEEFTAWYMDFTFKGGIIIEVKEV